MNTTSRSRTWIRLLVHRALITAVYLALTLIFSPIAFGMVQFRVSEALMILPALTPAGIWGVTIGCLLANILNPYNLGPVDIIFGTLATFIAAVIVRQIALRVQPPMEEISLKSPKLYLLLLPTIVSNALIVGFYLPFLLMDAPNAAAVLFSMLTVGLGEVGVLLLLGIPLLFALLRNVPDSVLELQ